MEEFKRRVTRRIILFSGMTLVAVALGIYSIFAMDNTAETSMAEGIITGFQFGIIFGISILGLLQIIKLRRAIKNEKNLKILYNQEHDERLKTIRSKAGMPMLMITSIIMLVVAIIVGYFNLVVFYTLVVAASVQLTIGALVKLYSMKKM